MKLKALIYLPVLLLFSACAGMQWYRGAVIEYTKVEKRPDNTYFIEVLGSQPHSLQDLKSAIVEKASELCGSRAKLIESKSGTYDSTTVGGGVVFNSTNPKISGIAKC